MDRQYNNKIDVCGGLYPVNLMNASGPLHWSFEPYRQQRRQGRCQAMRPDPEHHPAVCDRLLDLSQNRRAQAHTARPEILHNSPYNFVMPDEKGDPFPLVLAAQGHTNLISWCAGVPTAGLLTASSAARVRRGHFPGREA